MEEEVEEDLPLGGEDIIDLENDEQPPPPPPEEDKELLFLIEFLVDTLSLFPENLNLEGIDPCALQGPTSVILTFLHFPPMKLGEKDTDPDRRTGNDVIQYNSGKSLMFALTESQFELVPEVYLAITAMRDMPHAFRFPNISLGKAKIQLSELFKQLFDKYDENPTKTVSKSIKDTYTLMSDQGKKSAEVSLYIRLTCMGENIVTEFRKADDPDEPMLFKSKESKKVYECKEIERPDDEEGKVVPGFDSKKTCPDDPCNEKPDPADENFEKIFAEINGSSIVVNFEKSRRRSPPKPFHISEFCDCNIPLPQELVAGMSDLSISPVPEEGIIDQEKKSDHDFEPKAVGYEPETKQLVFTVPPVQKLIGPDAKTLVYNVNTCSEGYAHHHGKDRFKIRTIDNPDGPSPTLPNDPDKDVFILRIIKRGRNEHGRGNFSLEFKTPKEKIEPPPRKPYFIETAVGPEKKKKDKKKRKKK